MKYVVKLFITVVLEKQRCKTEGIYLKMRFLYILRNGLDLSKGYCVTSREQTG